MTADSNDIYICFLRGQFLLLGFQSHNIINCNNEFLATCLKWWTRTHNYKIKTFYHDSKLSLTKLIIFSHLYLRSVAPRKATSTTKCNVYFRVPRNLKSFTKPRWLTSL